jgi:hypothetical protein
MPTLSDKLYRFLSLVIGLAVFVFIFYRAAHMSITFDESGTTDVLDASYWDTLFAERFFQSANNHLLNSILMKFSAGIFGTSEIGLRLPNVLSYLFYFWGSYLIVHELTKNNWLRFSGLVMLNTIIFVIDFFSVARGYGLAISFEMMSLAMMIRHLGNGKQSTLFFSFLFASLAIYANFTWLNFFLPLWAVYNMMWLLNLKHLKLSLTKCWSKNSIPFFFSLLVTTVSYQPISLLRHQDEFRWGANAWIDSMHTFMKDFLYDNHFWFAVIGQIFLFLLFLIALIYTVRFIRSSANNKGETSLLVFITLLISTIVMATILQRNLLHSMYMDGRKALMYFPLVILLLLVVVNEYFHLKPIGLRLFSILLILISVFHFFYRVNTKAIREWWFDENSKEVAYYIHAHPVDGNRDVAVNWFYYPSIRFYNFHRFDTSIKRLVKMEEITDSTSFAYYYILGDQIRNVPPVYQPVFRFAWDRILLRKDSAVYLTRKANITDTLKRDNKLQAALMADSILWQERRTMDWTNLSISKNGIEEPEK